MNSRVSVDVMPPRSAARARPPYDHPRPDDSAFRAVPLLAVLDAADGGLIAVGQTRIVVNRHNAAKLTVVVRALWHGSHGTGTICWQAVDDHPELETLVSAAARLRDEPRESPEATAALIARNLAERSRDAVTALRSIRYSLESLLHGSLRGATTHDLEDVLANIVQMSSVCGRAGDEAREAAREGLWTWVTDGEAYNAHRRTLDPTQPKLKGHWRGRRRSWFVNLDAGVRHCLRMERLLAEEASIVHSLLNAASTIAVTRDARAQETFNVIAAVGGILFGLPALVISLYGASSLLPLTWSNVRALGPVIIAGLLAAGVAAVLPGKTRRARSRRLVAVTGAALMIVLLLAAAGWFFPVKSNSSTPQPAPSASTARP